MRTLAELQTRSDCLLIYAFESHSVVLVEKENVRSVSAEEVRKVDNSDFV